MAHLFKVKYIYIYMNCDLRHILPDKQLHPSCGLWDGQRRKQQRDLALTRHNLALARRGQPSPDVTAPGAKEGGP